jgi:uncharacterized RDD family membrane protein YckC
MNNKEEFEKKPTHNAFYGIDKGNPESQLYSDKMDIEDIYKNYEFPSLALRIKALFVDVLVMLIIFAVGATIIDFVGGAPNWVRGTILIFMLYFYDPFFTSFNGGTLGHYLMGLRVKRFISPTKNITLLAALFRFFIKGMLGWLSFLTVTSHARKRAIHDLVSGSIVFIK